MSDEGFDIGGLLRQAQELQAQMAAAEEAAGATVVEGTAGGGVVRVCMTAAGEFQSVTIAPEVVDPGDVEMLQDLVLAALRDAITRAAEVQASNAPQLGDLDLPDLGDLGRLLGGGGEPRP